MLSVKQVLDKFYSECNFKERILHDPIEFPHRYKRREDIEVSGFIASRLAYGKVKSFNPVIKKILSIMGRSPYDFLLSFRAKKQGRLFSGIQYRFNKNEDILCLLHITGNALKKHESLENAFKPFYNNNDPDTGSAHTGFINYILKTDTSDIYGRNIRTSGLIRFFPSPAKGSACKRMNLFLRWMIRDKDLDFGIWKDIPKNKLVIPLDTHIARISRCLGFTKRKSNNWKTAIEITRALKKLAPEDPLKYDFAMCHYGISGLCSSKSRVSNNCKKCFL